MIFTVRFNDPSLSKPLTSTVSAPDAETAINIVRDTYPWCDGFEIIAEGS